jgi:hypothetical protein
LENQAKLSGMNVGEQGNWQTASEPPSSALMTNYVKVEDGRNLISLTNALPHSIQVRTLCC